MTEISNKHLLNHKIANIFPMMDGDNYLNLKNDIKTNGLREPILIYEGKIIDGRNRYKACMELGIEPELKYYEKNGSLTNFVVSMNLHRRHLTSSQRAAIAVRIEEQLAIEAKERQRVSGGDRRSEDYQEKSVEEKFPEPKKSGQARDEAASLMGTNPRYVSDAKKIKNEDPELFEQVESGNKKIPQAMRELNGRENISKPMKTKKVSTVEEIEAMAKDLSVQDRQELIIRLTANEYQFKVDRMKELFEKYKDEDAVCEKLNEEGIKAEDNKSEWDVIMVLKFAGNNDNLRPFILTDG